MKMLSVLNLFGKTRMYIVCVPKYRSQSSNTVTIENENVPINNTNSKSSKSWNKNSVSWEDAKPYESIPGPKPLPIIGNTWRFLPVFGEYSKLTPLKQHELLRKQYGDIVILSKLIGRDDMVLTFNPEDFEAVFRSEGVWPERDALHSLVRYRTEYVKYAHPGLLAMQGEEWSKARSTVNAILMKPSSLKKYVPVIDKVADDFLKNIDTFIERSSEMPDDFQNELNRWSLETVACISLDSRLGVLDLSLPPDSEALKAINGVLEMFDLVYKLDILPSMYKYYNTKDWKRFLEVMDFVTGVWKKHIDAAKERMKDKDLSNNDDLSILEQILQIDEKIAYGMAIDMLSAGVDTTSKTVAAALYYLALNPDVQQKLRDEILKIFPDPAMPLNAKSMDSMPYLRAVIKETQRFAPIGSGNLRRIQRDTVLSGYRVPSGTQVITANLLLCQLEDHYVDADKFMPERWLRGCPENISTKNTNPFVYMPFGFGPRSCVGKRLALGEIEVLLTKMIQRYKIEWKQPPLPFKANLLYGVDGPLNYTITKI